MSKAVYKPQAEKIGTEEIFDLVFKDSSVKHGLLEFSADILKKISAFEKESGRFYICCLKRNKDIFIYDKNKKSGKPEEVSEMLSCLGLPNDEDKIIQLCQMEGISSRILDRMLYMQWDECPDKAPGSKNECGQCRIKDYCWEYIIK